MAVAEQTRIRVLRLDGSFLVLKLSVDFRELRLAAVNLGGTCRPIVRGGDTDTGTLGVSRSVSVATLAPKVRIAKVCAAGGHGSIDSCCRLLALHVLDFDPVLCDPGSGGTLRNLRESSFDIFPLLC